MNTSKQHNTEKEYQFPQDRIRKAIALTLQMCKKTKTRSGNLKYYWPANHDLDRDSTTILIIMVKEKVCVVNDPLIYNKVCHVLNTTDCICVNSSILDALIKYTNNQILEDFVIEKLDEDDGGYLFDGYDDGYNCPDRDGYYDDNDYFDNRYYKEKYPSNWATGKREQ